MEFFQLRGESGGPPSEPRRQSLRLRKKRIRHFNLPALTPVRSLLHPFLTDGDAARLMRVSHTTATHLLQGYTFTDHVIEPVDVEEMWRVKALYEAYDMRPTRMCLPRNVEEVALEEGSGRSPFPPSLTHLLLGTVPLYPNTRFAMTALSIVGRVGRKLVNSIQCLWMNRRCESLDAQYRELLCEHRSHPVFCLEQAGGLFKGSLQLGLLPHGLRYLQLSDVFNSPLQVGSFPSTVEVLQFGSSFNQPLSGVLPSSLVHLVLDCAFNHPLAAGDLPSSLQRLSMSHLNHPLTVGVLPSSLQALRLHDFNHPIPPQVLPSGLTHLSFGNFDHPLSVGSLPSSLISFDMGGYSDHPLLPNVLPSSLRVLFLSSHYSGPLTQGILPEGLVVLHYSFLGDALPLLSDILPSTVRVLDLHFFGGDIPAGAIPARVRCLRLPWQHRQRVAELRLSAETLVVWNQ